VTDGVVAVLASNFGARRHPSWYHNLIAYPATTVEIGADTWAVKATVATPEERKRLLGRILVETPSVAGAVRNTSREIPVVILHFVGKMP
jgi:deazaflavin-dependent oxidoreductase (nitroreductase family)